MKPWESVASLIWEGTWASWWIFLLTFPPQFSWAGSRNTSRQGATPTPSGSPTAGRTTQVSTPGATQALPPPPIFVGRYFFHFCFVVFVVSWSLLFHVFPRFWQAVVEWRFISQLSFHWLNVCPQVVDIKITSKITTHIPLESPQCSFDSKDNLFWKNTSLGSN